MSIDPELARELSDLRDTNILLLERVVDLTKRLIAIEGDRDWVAYGHKAPDGRVWAADVVHISKWPEIAANTGVQAVSAPTSGDQALEIANNFNYSANEKAGLA